MILSCVDANDVSSKRVDDVGLLKTMFVSMGLRIWDSTLLGLMHNCKVKVIIYLGCQI